MTRRWLVAALCVLGLAELAGAGPFNSGIGSAMYYGPYTGGHGYSYNVAYSYGFAFSPADTWRRDPLAYPAGVYPYPLGPYPPRRYLFPTAYPGYYAPTYGSYPTAVLSPVPQELQPATPLALLPVPGNTAGQSATIRVTVPASADVWFGLQKTAQTGTERTFQSPPVPPGRNFVYSVRAKWVEGGKEIEQFQAVTVRAGTVSDVRFPVARP
jgi:uncharacterized protein (TIGR03000 family)